jgi:hypothetical protein
LPAARPVFLAAGIAVAVFACHHEEPPVPRAPALPAEPELVVGSMDDECTGLTRALEAFAACPNADEPERGWLHATADYATESLALGKKGEPDEKAQHVMAIACRRAAVSVGHANERCHNGPRPREQD